MTKKSRRVKRRGRPVRLSPAQMVQPVADGVKVTESLPVTASTQSEPQVTDLREEYRYVIADLKRIGVIAVVMLGVLIVLALLLT